MRSPASYAVRDDAREELLRDRRGPLPLKLGEARRLLQAARHRLLQGVESQLTQSILAPRRRRLDAADAQPVHTRAVKMLVKVRTRELVVALRVVLAVRRRHQRELRHDHLPCGRSALHVQRRERVALGAHRRVVDGDGGACDGRDRR